MLNLRRRDKTIIVIGIIVLLLIVLRLMLPWIVTRYVNRVIDELPNYSGSITDVDIALYRGAYQIQGLELNKVEGKVPVPLISAEAIDLSIEWGALFHGRLVGEVTFIKPQLNFVASKKDGSADSSQYGDDVDWTEPIRALMPFEINVVKVEEGEVHFRDFTTDPQVDVYLKNVNGSLTNLTNATDLKKDLPSHLELNANILKNGKLKVNGDLNILRAIPDMIINTSVENVKLPELNDLSRAYAALDFEKGDINLYSEFKINDGIISGYLKPLMTNIDVIDLREDIKNPLKLIWESVAGLVLEIFENQPRDQVATKVPLEGDLNSPNIGVWNTVINIFKNAFIQAFRPGIDHDLKFGGQKKD